MKFKLFIDKEKTPEVIVYARQNSELIEKIRELALSEGKEIIGYIEREAVPLKIGEITAFISEDNKTFALVGDKKYKVRERLYVLENLCSENFVKINQSCLANLDKVLKFEAAFSGSLMVKFKNGYTDYVSRRCLKAVKERMGIK